MQILGINISVYNSCLLFQACDTITPKDYYKKVITVYVNPNADFEYNLIL